MNRNTKWGVIIITVGLLLLLNNLGIIAQFSTYWPVLIIIAGILMLFDQQTQGKKNDQGT